MLLTTCKGVHSSHLSTKYHIDRNSRFWRTECDRKTDQQTGAQTDNFNKVFVFNKTIKRGIAPRVAIAKILSYFRKFSNRLGLLPTAIDKKLSEYGHKLRHIFIDFKGNERIRSHTRLTRWTLTRVGAIWKSAEWLWRSICGGKGKCIRVCFR